MKHVRIAFASSVEAAPERVPLTESEFNKELSSAMPALRTYGRSLTRNPDSTDDLVQETVLKAWAARNRFEAGTNFRGWLYTIMRNLHTSQMRRSGRIVELDEIAAERIMAVGSNQEDHIHLKDTEAMIDRLNPAQRHALVSVTMLGKSFEEVAAESNVPIGTIKAQFSRGRAELKVMNGDLPRILTIPKLKACFRAHYEATGEWPLANNTYVRYGPYAGLIKWCYIPDCLKHGMNGLPKGYTFQSLRKKVQKEVMGVEGTRSHHSPLEIGKIKECIRAYYEATGAWPLSNQKGIIEHGPYKNILRWESLAPYLAKGKRGLPKGHTFSSLRKEVQMEVLGQVAEPPRGGASHKTKRQSGTISTLDITWPAPEDVEALRPAA